MNKLPEIRLPTFHGKEWAAVAITAVLAVFSTIYVALKPSASTAGRIENGSKETYEEEEYDHVYTNRSEETSDKLLKWLGTRKSFHEVLRQHAEGQSSSALKVKLQQMLVNTFLFHSPKQRTASNNEDISFITRNSLRTTTRLGL